MKCIMFKFIIVFLYNFISFLLKIYIIEMDKKFHMVAQPRVPKHSSSVYCKCFMSILGFQLSLIISQGCKILFLELLKLNVQVVIVQVISTARTCNCILIVLDAIKPITHKRLIEKELEGFGIR